MQFKFHSFTALSNNKVKAVLKGGRYEPQATLTLTVSRMNDLVVGAKIGDTVEITMKRV